MTGVFENLAQFFKLCDLYCTGFFKSSTVLLNNGMMPTYTGCRGLWRGTGTQESLTPAIGSWFKSTGISIVQCPSSIMTVKFLWSLLTSLFFGWKMVVYIVFIGNLCNMSVSFRWANNFTISPDLTISESKRMLNNKIAGDRGICKGRDGWNLSDHLNPFDVYPHKSGMRVLQEIRVFLFQNFWVNCNDTKKRRSIDTL